MKFSYSEGLFLYGKILHWPFLSELHATYHTNMCDDPLRNRSNCNFREFHWTVFFLKKSNEKKFSSNFFGDTSWPDSMRVCMREQYALVQIGGLLLR